MELQQHAVEFQHKLNDIFNLLINMFETKLLTQFVLVIQYICSALRGRGTGGGGGGPGALCALFVLSSVPLIFIIYTTVYNNICIPF